MSDLWDVLKDKLSSAKDGAEKIAKIAIDKTSNAVDVTKLNLAKNEADNKINKLCAKIGKLIYEQHKNGAEFENEISEILIEIDKFQAESDELKEQIAALKNADVPQDFPEEDDAVSEEQENATVDVVPEDK